MCSCHTTQCHRCLKPWGSVELACWIAWMSTRAVTVEFYVNFSTISRLQRCFREFGSTSNRPHNCRPHQPRTFTSGFFICVIVWDQPPGQLMKLWVCTTKELLHKRSEICVLVVLTRVLTWLQFSIVTDFSGQMLTFDGHWHAGEVCSSQMNPCFNCTGQMANSITYMALCGRAVYWCQRRKQCAPCWW